MKVRFENAALDRLETDQTFTGGYGREVIRGFRKALQAIRAARYEPDLYQMKSLRFEKLKGRPGERSMRLNVQWRLILRIEESEPLNIVVVVGIEDYH
jgi:toxin HigB-1